YLWTSFGNLIRQFLGFALSMLLARLLAPSDYGLVGMVLVFTSIASGLQDLGFGQAVIYFRSHESSLPTYFTVTTFTSVLLTALMFTAAPLIADLYENPIRVPITRWLSLTLLYSGLRSVSQGVL